MEVQHRAPILKRTAPTGPNQVNAAASPFLARLVILSFVVAIGSGALPAATWFVDSGAAPGGDGRSWK